MLEQGVTQDDRRARVQFFAAKALQVQAAIATVIDGKPDQIRLALTAVLSSGHLLIEDVPGVGKTALARTLAAVLDIQVRRIQFTPDLLPSDITGVSAYHAETQSFTFVPGAVFTNVLIADEVNRSSPKTQSALLEAMEERRVSVDGQTHRLPEPFLVVATQNPADMEGTYPLPEAQRDRFMIRTAMGYPAPEAEIRMLRQRRDANRIDRVTAVLQPEELALMLDIARSIHVAPAVEEYIVALAQATRRHPGLRLGASPRATLQLLSAAQTTAALASRGYVIPEDVLAMLDPVFTHRLLPAHHAGASAREILAEIAASVPAPVPGPR